MRTYSGPTRLCSALAIIVLLWLVPAGVNAWTETQIVSVSARVDARTPRAGVALELGLRVREGWLSSFDLLDLGPDLALDEPPQLQFVGSDGTVYTPSVQMLPGSGVSLQFPDKRSAPRRGEYTVQLAWRTRLAEAGAGMQRWSLPRWPERVPNVRVEVLAALGARPSVSRARPHDAAEFRDVPAEHMSVLHYVSAELPRTARLDVSWSPPAAAQRGRAGDKASWPAIAQQPLPWWLGACLSLLWLLKWSLHMREHVSASDACSRQRQAPSSLGRAVASALGCGLAVALFDAVPLWAAALGVASCLWASHASSPRAPRALAGGNPDAPQRILDQHGGAFLDVTTPAGAGVALIICALLCWLRPLAPSTVACSACLTAALLLGTVGVAAGSHRPR